MALGRLITIEGIDGAGKTTHARLLADWLIAHRIEVSTFREPGGTPLGESLRALLKGGMAQSALAELLLFAAARAELVRCRLRPELATGKTVLLDRFTDSTLAYQGALGQIDEASLQSVCTAAADGLTPDLTLWLDLSPEQAFARIATEPSGDGKGRDRIEQRGLDYFRRIREIYLAIARAEPGRVVRINADAPVEQVQAAIVSVVQARMPETYHG